MLKFMGFMVFYGFFRLCKLSKTQKRAFLGIFVDQKRTKNTKTQKRMSRYPADKRGLLTKGWLKPWIFLLKPQTPTPGF